ncbi:MAG TPA: ribosome maturation factor RimM [Thermoanaerobaculia bacterium]|nr:ribosome maturation factor RimM [Thermoanaerobaculia bacterium]
MASRHRRDFAPSLPETVVVGRVLRPHGVRGEAVVEVHTDRDDRFCPGAELTCELDAGDLRLVVESSRAHKGRLLVRFAGVADRDLADELRGGILSVSRDLVAPAPEGSYYHFELVGCAVVDRVAGLLGEVTDVLEDGGGLLLEVGGDRGVLVPFVNAYLDEVDVESRRIDVTLPAGLIEACGSTS